jgi:hypothetical protein
MNANSREATLKLYRTEVPGKFEQKEYEWSQAAKSRQATEPGRSSATIWTTAVAAMQAIGYGFRQLLHDAAPAGESNFKRQML